MAETDYKSTLALPKTDFPMKANLAKREPEILKRWDEIDIYALLLETRKDRPAWILHDGPPYANGRAHLGTALNKILKDFVVRSRSMLGNRTPFVPGWDCHGMPIEHKVSRDLGAKARTMPKLELRKRCRAEAEKWIDLQRGDYRRLGCIGDWFNPYLTMAPAYDAAEIGVLRDLVERGYVYRGLRPVHWCFDCRTGLAEAEVEYGDHKSPAIYVAFALNQNAGDAGALVADRADRAELSTAHKAGNLFAVIWTTTPWTLPANLGISLNETFDYVALKVRAKYYIVAARLAEAVTEAISKEAGLTVEKSIALDRAAIHALDGKDIFRHPFLPRDVKLMYAEHVTADAGTGLVHTAPGHGYEDFVVGAKYGIEPFTPVDGAGVFTAKGGEWAGRNVFEANDSIVARLRETGALLAAHTIAHSYPHCWRCHKPLIFRATEQWFLRIDHEGLRDKVVAAIDSARWVPGWSRDRIRNMTETRPDWNLSRQRAWGVPIPALRCTGCGNVILDSGVMKLAEAIFAKESSDAWFERPASDFIPPGLKCPKCSGAAFTKEEDVLDVWFDSGCSQAAVLAIRPELAWPADAYLEAVEQARGWFSSSLTCAVAQRGAAPFRAVISHGLTVDERGRKMSKSLGNTEDAYEVANRLGSDVIRLVYASLDYTSEIALGPTIFGAVSESYRKIRNTCKYLLGNLSDFDPARDAVAHSAMLEFDRFILARLERLKTEVRRAFDNFDFQAAYSAMSNFIVVDLSSLYIDVARDRLYCDGKTSVSRRSAQSALYQILDALVRMLAPLIPYTTEEIYSYVPGKTAESVHLLELQPAHPEWTDAALAAKWDALLDLRVEALQALEEMRKEGKIGAPLEAVIGIGVHRDNRQRWKEIIRTETEAIKQLFIVSGVSSLDDQETEGAGRAIAREGNHSSNGRVVRGFTLPRHYSRGETKREPGESTIEGAFDVLPADIVLTVSRAPGMKCHRCWCYFDDGDPELCPRCRAVVRA